MSDQEAPTTEPVRETNAQKAQRFFGNSFVGEVEAPLLDASVEETNEDALEEEPIEEPQEEVEEAEESLEAVEAEEVETESPEVEEVPISSINELIETSEYDPEWFNSLKVPVKVDGKEDEATLTDLVNSYQIQQAAEHRLEEAKNKAKSITQEMAEKSEALNVQFSTVAELINNAEELLESDFKNVNWQDLRSRDPAEYAAKKRDFDDRRANIERIKNGAGEQYQQHLNQQNSEMQAQYQTYLQQERAKLEEALPEWKDPEKASVEKSKIADYLYKQGFSKDDVQAASDHRLIVMARKAMLYDATSSKAEVALKKVAKIPKVTKPGTTKSAEQTNNQN